MKRRRLTDEEKSKTVLWSYFNRDADLTDPQLEDKIEADARTVLDTFAGSVLAATITEAGLHAFYLNVTTLEDVTYCVEVTEHGFRVVGRGKDVTDLTDQCYFPTVHGLLLDISPRFADLYGGRMVANIVRRHLAYIRLIQESDFISHFNVTTMENVRLCLELSPRGCRILGRNHDDMSLTSPRYSRHIFATLEEESRYFKNNFGIPKLQPVPREDSSGSGSDSDSDETMPPPNIFPDSGSDTESEAENKRRVSREEAMDEEVIVETLSDVSLQMSPSSAARAKAKGKSKAKESVPTISAMDLYEQEILTAFYSNNVLASASETGPIPMALPGPSTSRPRPSMGPPGPRMARPRPSGSRPSAATGATPKGKSPVRGTVAKKRSRPITPPEPTA